LPPGCGGGGGGSGGGGGAAERGSSPGPSYRGGPVAGPGTAELERKLAEARASAEQLARANEELERRLDTDGKQFLEAIFALEGEVEELKKQNRSLEAGDGLPSIPEAQDVLQQLDEFEREKEEEIQRIRDEAAQIQHRLVRQEQAAENYRRKYEELERERESLLEVMTEEGQELRARLEKALRDKEALSLDLGRAQAMADHAAEAAEAAANSAAAGQGSSAGGSTRELAEAASRLRTVVGEREALKDEVANKEGQIVLLRSQLEIAERKLRLADYESTMLKSELEVLRRQAGGGIGGLAAAARPVAARTMAPLIRPGAAALINR